MFTKFFILFKSLVKDSPLNNKKRKEINYLTSNTGTSEFLNSLSETEPICVSETSFSSNDTNLLLLDP